MYHNSAKYVKVYSIAMFIIEINILSPFWRDLNIDLPFYIEDHTHLTMFVVVVVPEITSVMNPGWSIGIFAVSVTPPCCDLTT